MKNPEEKVNIEAFRDAKKLHLAGRGYSPIYTWTLRLIMV